MAMNKSSNLLFQVEKNSKINLNLNSKTETVSKMKTINKKGL
jgi:hypothetical protein